MEIICINNTYDSETARVFAKYDIKTPALDEIVTMVGYEKLPRVGKIGLFIEPYTKQYISGEIFGIKGEKEVSYDSKRFTTLLGEPITEEMLKATKNSKKEYIETPKINKLDKSNPYNN